METVIQALEKMGRATYREVAARLDIEPVEALNMLREQRDQGLCDFSDGGWFVGSARDAKRVACVPPVKPALHGEAPEPVDPAVIKQLLAKNGAMDTVSLAAAVEPQRSRHDLSNARAGAPGHRGEERAGQRCHMVTAGGVNGNS
ncbi:hypothetical protein DR73_782 [Enterobacteriaceae bacterium ATCC 29904]|nr:hypothetical protein DR73_782 [Enterobacteriaceae bacterium ATCC 29904]